MHEGKVQLKTYVPPMLAREVQILLIDTETGRIKHGALSALVTELLENWVTDMRKKHDDAKRRAIRSS